MKPEDLTKEKQIFFRERYLEYIKDGYKEDFIGNREGRPWWEWARDKAWDDVLCMNEVIEALEEEEWSK